MRIPNFALDQWLNNYHFSSNRPRFDFASSTGPHWTLREILGFLSEDERTSVLDTELVYSSASGTVQLRAAIADMQGVSADEIQIVTGASEALLILFFLAAEPGANVILPFPLFPSTAVSAELLGLEIRYYHLRRENNFRIDPDEVKKLADNQTKLLLVNSPHNPTGSTLSDAELLDLHDFAADRGITFVSDEVYHPIYHGQETNSASVLPRATVLGSFSKALSLSGLRIGWIVERDAERRDQYTQARGYFSISNAPIAEKVAVIALQHRQKILERSRTVATANLQLLDQFFAEHEHELGWVRPRGGMTGFPWLKSGSDAREFCRAVAARGVLLAPGDCFGMAEHFRLGFGVTPEGFASGLETISNYLKEHHLTSAAKVSV
jgi:aspartate/methionine/tyrosine aminotransferase